MPKLQSTTPRVLFAGALAILLLLACWLAAGSAEAGKGAQKASQIGKTKRTPPPDCPRSARLGSCEAIGKTTAIQIRADGKNLPSRALHDGKVVAYSFDMGYPEKDAQDYFGDMEQFGNKHFGKKPTVRLSVLKRKGGRKFKLKRQSPTVVVQKSAFGRRYYVTLDEPLRVTKGLYVGLTVPTWLTALQGRTDKHDKIPGHFSSHGNEWLSSRPASQCRDSFNVKPQQKIGSTKTYGCKFDQARVLYKAYYVKKKKK